MFCPKCGSILTVKKVGNKKTISCSCGYVNKKGKMFSIKESIAKTKDIEVVEKDDTEETLPKIKARCNKCNNNEVYYWLIQTRAGDEPETKFLKCTKCKHIWRDYS